MVLACALLFSCATDSETASGNDTVPEVTPLVSAVSEIPASTEPAEKNLSTGDEKKSSVLGHTLSAVPVYAEWSAKYEPEQNPLFKGIPLISGHTAFDSIPDDIRARKVCAEELCDQNRFLDAWYAYGEDDNEYIIALKIMHLIDFYTDTIDHQIFVLSNLEADQDLYEYRDNFSQKGEHIFWNPVEVVDAYVADYCEGVMPHILEMAMGCYFESVAYVFGDEWTSPQEDVYELSVEYFSRSIAAGAYNDYSLYTSVDAFLSAGYFSDAIAILQCLEQLEPEFSYHYYREALAYEYSGNYQKALPAAARAALLSTVPEDLSSAVHVFADSFMYEGRQVENALDAIEAAKPLVLPVYYDDLSFKSIEILLYAAINGYEGRNYETFILSALTDAFSVYPEDCNYLWALTDYFYTYYQIPLGIAWITSVLPDWDTEPLPAGNLNFELGQLYIQTGDYQKALDCFNKAEEYLTEAGVFDSVTNTIPYYQNLCCENLFMLDKDNSI